METNAFLHQYTETTYICTLHIHIHEYINVYIYTYIKASLDSNLRQFQCRYDSSSNKIIITPDTMRTKIISYRIS